MDTALRRSTSSLRPLLAVVGGAVVLLGALSVWAGIGYAERLDALRHTVEVQRSLAQVLSTVQDTETGQRGFLLTGAEDFLTPYDSGRRALPGRLDALNALVADNPNQAQAVAALRPIIGAKLTELDAVLTLQRNGPPGAAVARVRTGYGKRLMDDVRARIGAMETAEQALLTERSSSSARLYLALRLSQLAVMLTLLAGLVVWLIQARRDAAVLAVANDELKTAHARLREEMAEREHAEDQVRHMQKLEAVGQLTGGIAHDFNNMLAVIVGALGLARRRISDPSRVLAYIEQADTAAGRAAALTRRLLAFSRQQPLEPRPVDINRLLAGVSELLPSSLGGDIKLETVLAGGLWRAQADPGEVENAVLNLAINARDAMPEGGRLTIETANAHLDDAYAASHTDATAGQYVLISVTDTGAGMPGEVLARAFDPFFTTKEVGKGTGLGLSQVYGFARQTGGHAKIYSEPGRGATVKLYLPRSYEAERPATGALSAPAGELPAGSPEQLVLVVEDDASVRDLSVEALRALGYGVRHAGDGAEALAMLQALPEVTLLFTDVVMPGMSGRELAELALAMRPALKVLYTTGYTRNAVVHNGVVDPGVALLQKPFTVDQLASKVATVLAG